jgi:pyochelin synthetase
MVIKLLSRIEAKGISLVKDGESLRFEAPRGLLNEAIINDVKKHKAELLQLLAIENDAPYRELGTPSASIPDAFALSPLQQAYWVGEKSFFQQNCKAYYYNEYRVQGLDLLRLENALNKLLRDHDALRMAVNENGQQHFAPFEPQQVECIDLKHCSPRQAEQHLADYRCNIENRLPAIDSGKPYLFTVHHLPDTDIFSFTFRLIAVDAVSFNLLIGELIKAYQDSIAPQAQAVGGNTLKHTYYDYIKFLENRKQTRLYRQAYNYWHDRAESLPSAPQLPYREVTGKQKQELQTFERLRGRLEGPLWQRLRERAQGLGLTVNSVLCCLYADVVARWSASSDFTLNVLVSDRPGDIPGIDTLVGNCSTTVLLEVHQQQNSFIERAKSIRLQLYRDIENSALAGVELIRLLQSHVNTGNQPPMPVVFTSGIDIPGAASDFTIHESDWTLNQTHLKTPQVWLDHQVYQDDGELVYNWDYVPEVFPQALIPDMFSYYEDYLRFLAENDKAWHQASSAFPLPRHQMQVRDAFNSKHAPRPVRRLHEGFVDMALQWPQRTALMTSSETISYGELYHRALAIAVALNRHCQSSPELNVTDNHVIGVCCQKGADQIAAVLGTLIAGYTYLPIDVKTPAARIDYIAQHSNATAILADTSGCKTISGDALRLVIAIDSVERNTADARFTQAERKLEERAYIIYTSGSTGNPKGVVINHLGAMTTIEDMVRRFGLMPEDRVLGLSALNFDLSVYDIFATLSQGAALVIPPEMDVPDPGAWTGLLRERKVTVWNSVPALLQITLEYLRDDAASTLASLRLAMLSGDWIPGALAENLKALTHVQAVSLGGATEASIWSNYYVMDGVPQGWTSIPYGVPLTNQSMHILDEQLNPCPEWVVGDLYIGGDGVAMEYLNDPEKTANSFIAHSCTGERLYRTGDLARVRDGLIEFIGRADFQVKVRGFRVELGEIGAQLNAMDIIEKSVVVMMGEGNAEQQLVGFYVSQSDDDDTEAQVRQHLKSTLPHYMVPNVLVKIDDIPLSSNAKVDRKNLLSLVTLENKVTEQIVKPSTTTEHRLFNLWQNLLPEAQFGIHENFFEIGGNSLVAVRLTNDIEDAFSLKLPLSVFFQHSNVHALAAEIDKRITHMSQGRERSSNQDHSVNIVQLAPSTASKKLFLVHPVGGNVVCYQALAGRLTDFQCFGIQSAGIAHDFDGVSGNNVLPLIDMATNYAQSIEQSLKHNNQEKVFIGGWSMGAVLSNLIAEILRTKGYSLAPTLLIDPWVSNGSELNDYDEEVAIRGFVTDLLGSDLPITLTAKSANQSAQAYLNDCVDVVCKQTDITNIALLAGMDKTVLLELFLQYFHNAVCLRIAGPQTLLGDYCLFQTSADQANLFPGLQPATASQDNPQLAGRGVSRAQQLTELSHWEIMQTENLLPIVDTWLKEI